MPSRINGFIPIFLLLFLVACSLSPTAAATETSAHTATSTETRLPTSTHTATASPSANLTVTQESTPELARTNVVSTNTNLEQRTDGVWVYSDYEAGYQFAISGDWFLDDVSALSAPQILGRTNTYKDELGLSKTVLFFLEPEGTRVIGIYLDESVPDYMSVSFTVANILNNKFAAMSLEDMQSQVLELAMQTYDLTVEEIETGIFINDQGIEYGVAFYPIGFDFYQLRIIFEIEEGMGIITFGFSENNVEHLGSDWQMVIHSIRRIEPAGE